MNNKRIQRGQALILIVLGTIGLVAITALAIDAGNSFSDRRHAQNAADTAALAAALAKINSQDFNTAATNRATSNGYDGVTNNTVTVNNPPAAGCDGSNGPYAGNDEYIQVIIRSDVNTFFAPIVGIRQVHNCVEAIARAKPPTPATMFNGNALVALGPTGLDFTAIGTPDWVITGGGIYVNSDSNPAAKIGGSGTVIAPSLTSCGGVSGSFLDVPIINIGCTPLPFPPNNMIMPPIPPCDGTAYTGADGKIHEEVGKEGRGSIVPFSSWAGDYAPGLYCVTGTGGNIHDPITGTGVTFVILSPDFTLKFNGGGGFNITAMTTDTYANLAIYLPLTPKPYTQHQQLELKGNGSAGIVGSVLAPSAYIDMRGNSIANPYHSQVIGYTVTSGGTTDIALDYQAGKNYLADVPPQIEVTK